MASRFDITGLVHFEVDRSSVDTANRSLQQGVRPVKIPVEVGDQGGLEQAKRNIQGVGAAATTAGKELGGLAEASARTGAGLSATARFSLDAGRALEALGNQAG